MDPGGDGAGLGVDAQRLGFAAENPVETSKAEDDAATRRRRAGRIAGAGSPGDDGNAVDSADADDPGRLLGGGREHDGVGKVPLAGGTPGVIRVRGEIRGTCVDV